MVDQGAVNAMVSQPSGMVARYIEGKGTQVAAYARQIAPRRESNLVGNIEVRMDGAVATVIANVSYALVQELGARPHVIVPRGPGYPLRFKVGGMTVFARKVNHPGNVGQHYLEKSLRAVIER